ncbi:MAG TPA: hypothetical protein VHQ86_02680 [Candidatus Saccharimonadia bacterium]|jgi:hypothetical protein|nr:hypothetical protein [Candidatus Saccharimonadia bacterium]
MSEFQDPALRRRRLSASSTGVGGSRDFDVEVGDNESTTGDPLLDGIDAVLAANADSDASSGDEKKQ